MFISLSKTIARFGGFRLGIGMRLNKKNAMWMWLILFFVGMFQLMWGMMLICGWLIYAMFYGLYWCIKKIIRASSKKQTTQRVQNTYQNPQTERKEDSPTMTPEMNNTPNGNPNNKSPKSKSAIVRWIVGGFFAMFALVNGFHFSSLFLLCAAFLMFPFPFMETFLQKKNIKAIVAIILSVALFFAGVLTSPPSESTDPSDDTTQTTPSENEDKNNNSTKPDTSTTKPDSSTTKPDNSTSNNNQTTTPDNTTTEEEKVQMVWVASSGTKYHSRSSCSNMNSPRQIPLEDAQNQGYTACKKCH